MRLKTFTSLEPKTKIPFLRVLFQHILRLWVKFHSRNHSTPACNEVERGQPPGTEIKPWPRQQSEAMIKSSTSAHSTPLAAAASWWAHQLPPGTRVFETHTETAPCCFSSLQSSLVLMIQGEAASCKCPCITGSCSHSQPSQHCAVSGGWGWTWQFSVSTLVAAHGAQHSTGLHCSVWRETLSQTHRKLLTAVLEDLLQ